MSKEEAKALTTLGLMQLSNPYTAMYPLVDPKFKEAYDTTMKEYGK